MILQLVTQVFPDKNLPSIHSWQLSYVPEHLAHHRKQSLQVLSDVSPK